MPASSIRDLDGSPPNGGKTIHNPWISGHEKIPPSIGSRRTWRPVLILEVSHVECQTCFGQRDFTCEKRQFRGPFVRLFFLAAESEKTVVKLSIFQVPQIWSKNSAEMWVFDQFQLMSVTSFQTIPFQRKPWVDWVELLQCIFYDWWVSWTSCSWVKLVKFPSVKSSLKMGKQFSQGWRLVSLNPWGEGFLGGGNSNIFYVHPYLGRWSNLTNIFQMGWNHQLLVFNMCLHMFTSFCRRLAITSCFCVEIGHWSRILFQEYPMIARGSDERSQGYISYIVYFLLNQERFRTPEPSKSQGEVHPDLISGWNQATWSAVSWRLKKMEQATADVGRMIGVL